ncbi:hypothetical protein [Jatrophihabitans sp.]|uniref:hypothetical protein n=1 Tax=Jatrophihabitans sp. TaxID=1932789 RepID=UPI0030C6B38E|nr:hypothetical protein [Jatrophihabitans sp.]
MTAPSDPRAAVEYRVQAVDLKVGDIVNTSPGEDDWQQVLGVYKSATDTNDDELAALVTTLGGRYVAVELTDLAPVDSGIYFSDGLAMSYATDDGADHPVDEVISSEFGVRTYLYTKFELVTIRSTGS